MLISEDNGITWKHRITLEAMQKGKLTDDHWLEFSYPTVAITPDGRIAVVYTWHRFNIRFLCGTAEEFISGAWNYFVPTYEKTLGNPAIAIPQVPPEWLGSHALSSATGCLFASYNYGNLHPISPGQTEDSFTSFVSIGWNLQGLCFNFIVKSDAIDSHEKVPGTFYIRSCAELFLAPEDGKLWTRNNFSFERIQLMLSQPDEDGQIENCVIYDGCFHGPEYPPLNHIAVGERIQNGCMVHILLPWQSLGYSSIHDVIPSLRIQINTHSYQITDGKITEDRRMTLNGEPVLYSSSDCYPTFCLCNRIQDNPFPSLDTAWNPAVPALFETDEAEIPLNMPDWLDYGIVSIQDSESGTRLFTRRLAPNQSTLTLNNLASWHAIGLHFQFSGYIQGQCIGIVERQATLSAWLTTLLARTDWRNLKDWKILGMAALVSALEFLRLTHTANALNRFRRSDAIWECSARLALLDNRPLPAGTPDYLHLLELQRGFQAQLNVSFSQGGRSYERKSAAISLPWGNIPVVNCEITQCRTEEEAKVGFTQTTAFFTPIEAPHINGADSVFAGYGFLMMDALKNDLEPHRQVSVISKNWPHQSLRLPPEDALKLPIEAIVLLPDTPETMKKVLFSQAASRNLPLIDWANRTDYSLVAVGGIPPFNEISSFWHSRNGLPGKILVARKEKNIFWTQYEIPELGIEFLEFILKGAPITQEQAAHFASLRASHLPKPKPKDRAQVSHLWTGDVHTHSTASDGQSTPLGLRFNAIPPGFDFIVISDHDEIQGALDLIRKFRNCHCRLPIFAGQEITRQPRYHLNVYPIHQKITDVATWEIIKKAAAAQNAIVQLNHPMTYGTELSDAWYGDFTLSGCDAVERRFEYWPTWQQTGKGHLPAMTGSTDAHFGIFGFLTCTVLLADSLTETTLAEAIRQGKTACIDPMTGMLAYGNEDLCRIIAAALMDSSSPERFFNRLKDNFSDFSFFYPLSTNQKGETKHA